MFQHKYQPFSCYNYNAVLSPVATPGEEGVHYFPRGLQNILGYFTREICISWDAEFPVTPAQTD